MATWTERGSLRGPAGADGSPGSPGAPGEPGVPGADGGTTPHAARHAIAGDDPVSPASIGAAAVGDLDDYQPLDANLTDIVALSPSDGTFLKRASGVWTASGLTKSDVGLGNVDNTADTAKPVSTVTQTALDGKQPLDTNLTVIASLSATANNIIQSVAGVWDSRTPAQVKTSLSLVKADVGLGNVDNTADTAKPVSSATQTALDGKQTLDSDLTSFAGLTPTNDDIVQRKAGAWTNRTPAQLKTDLVLTKSDVGLGSVDNTADTAKPISTLTQTALDGKQPLDSDLTTIAGLVATTDNFMVASASAWASRTPAQAKTALSLTKSDVGLGSVDNTSDAAKPISTATQTALDGKQSVDSDLTALAGLTATTDNIIQSVAGVWASRTPAQVKTALAIAQSDVSGLVTDLAAKQPLDADLTSIAGLTATTDNIIQSVGSAWASRTPAQLKTSLSLVKADVGLGSVDNTADTAKPVSTAQQTALDGKQTLDSDLTSIAGLTPTNDDIIQRKAGAWANRTVAQFKTDLTLTKSDVGLGNVDNTADTAKPVSTLQQTALDGKQTLDSDLTAIAGLTPTNDDFVQRKAGAWANRTVAQVKTDLAYTAGDVGAQPLDADLTTLAGLTATTDNFIVSVSSAWASRTPAQVKTLLALGESDISGLVTDLAGKQPLDSDLTTIAGLTATTDNIIQSVGSAWASRTPAQLKTSMSFVKADVGLGSVDNTADTAKPVSSAQQTALDGKQGVDSDLTDIAALSPTNDDILQRKAGAWTNRTIAQLKTDLNYQAVDFGAQPLDSDLTTIAGLTATTDNIIQSVAGAWASRTPSQVKTALSLVKADVGLGSVDNTSDAAKPVSSATQTALDGKQALDSDLTTIAGLTATTDNFIVSVASAWASRTPAQVKTTLAIAEADVSGLVTDLAGKQPLDSDLTTIAGLTATTDGILQSKASAWSVRTPAQLKTDLAIVAGDITSGVFGIAQIPTGTSGTTVPFGNDSRFTDSRAPNGTAGGVLNGTYPNPGLDLVTSTPYAHGTTTGTVTIDPTLGNNVNVGTLTGNIILTPSTTGALDGQMLMVQVKCDASIRTITITGPTLTTGLSSPFSLAASKYAFLGFRYSSALGAWVLLAYTASL